MDIGRLDMVPSGIANLDTVRALHHTVVSLRKALEISRNELKKLKEKYEQHSDCLEYADVIDKLTVENHLLRSKIIKSGLDDVQYTSSQDINIEVTHSPQPDEIGSTIETEIPPVTKFNQSSPEEATSFISPEKLTEILEVSENSEIVEVEDNISADISKQTEEYQSDDLCNECNKEEPKKHSFSTNIELMSKFDVKIKVRTLNKGVSSSASTSESDSTKTTGNKTAKNQEATTGSSLHFDGKREQFEEVDDLKGNKINVKTSSNENIRMAVPNENEAKKNVDKFDIQVRITSEENLVVRGNLERNKRKDTLNLDVDDLSLRSMSEGDNSVFSESVTPLDPNAISNVERRCEQDENASGNESEEVDDIELIFTTDESKDISNLQEDLVSIRETEQWAPSSESTTHSTPVLIKFNTLDPDFQLGIMNEDGKDTKTQESNKLLQNITESAYRQKRVSLPNDKEIRYAALSSKGSLDLPGKSILKSYENKSDNMLYKKSPNMSTKRLESVDSLTTDYKGLSFDNTKSSSFELGSSMDILHRDGSIDSFHRTINLGRRFSVFPATDLTKCGVSEDDLTSNLYTRRNTCPNPFQYKAPNNRSVTYSRGPVKTTTSHGYSASRTRPIVRYSTGVRRENCAQTDVCALPPRWTSDGYLAHKSPVPISIDTPTLSHRKTINNTKRLTVPSAKPALRVQRTDETRRIMLSDIGFTSMVPELSRSADPLWAAASRRQHSTDAEVDINNSAKFLSRGVYRSPRASVDRGTEWTPLAYYTPTTKVDYRRFRCSLPDVRGDDTDELLDEAEAFVRRSIDNLHSSSAADVDRWQCSEIGRPYIPAEPKNLRLGHTVKVITPQGRVAVGRVRYVGLAGSTAASSSNVVGVEFALSHNPGLPRNDGTYCGRRYFLAPPHYTALFVPFSKVVMAWAN